MDIKRTNSHGGEKKNMKKIHTKSSKHAPIDEKEAEKMDQKKHIKNAFPNTNHAQKHVQKHENGKKNTPNNEKTQQNEEIKSIQTHNEMMNETQQAESSSMSRSTTNTNTNTTNTSAIHTEIIDMNNLDGLAHPEEVRLALQPYNEEMITEHEQYFGENGKDTHGNRRWTRRALIAFRNKAEAMVTSTKSSSVVLKFGIETAAKFANPAANMMLNKWETYADPLITRIDRKVDAALDVVSGTRLMQNRSQSDARQEQHALQPHALHNDETALETELSESIQGMSLDTSQNTLYTLYWQRLKERFMHSKWYNRVDEILLQNVVVKAFQSRVVEWQRPAEVFYNSVTDDFMCHDSYDDFLAALKMRLGLTWDDRLAPLAKAFFTTAKAVSTVVGAGRFVSGAVQLGKAKVHHALDDLLARWDRVLGLTDDMIDRYLPERDDQRLLLLEDGELDGSTGSCSDANLEDDDTEGVFSMDMEVSNHHQNHNKRSLHRHSAETKGKNLVNIESSKEHINHHNVYGSNRAASTGTECTNDDAMAISNERRSQKRGHDMVYPSSSENEIDRVLLPGVPQASRNSVSGLSSKLHKRLRQRMSPMAAPQSDSVFVDDLKRSLIESSWFSRVDEILLQNVFVHALASFMRPADHFFNTSIQLLLRRPFVSWLYSNSNSCSDCDRDRNRASVRSSFEDFLVGLRSALGSSWDERLVSPANSLFNTAIHLQSFRALVNRSSRVSSRVETSGDSSLSTSLSAYSFSLSDGPNALTPRTPPPALTPPPDPL